MTENQGAVALVVADLGGGGSQRVVSAVANAWAAEGRNVTVITIAGPESDHYSLAPPVRRFVLGGAGVTASLIEALWENLRRVIRLRRALKETEVSTALGFILPINVTLLLASLGLGIKVVLSERNDPARQSFGRVWGALRWFLYRFAGTITANSRAALETMKAYVPASKLVYLPNPLPAVSRRPVSPEPVILAVGRLNHQKAHDVLIDAFSRVAGVHPEWRLWILGEGDLRPVLERKVKELNLVDRIHLPGWVEDPYQHYLRAGMFVLPSRFEGTSNALLEAMGCGLPVIVSDSCPGSTDLIEDEVSGIVVPVDDTDSLADAMTRLIADEGMRSRMGSASREKIRSLEKNDDVLDIWNTVVLGNNG